MKKGLATGVRYFGQHWYTIVVSVFVGILMISCLELFENYWWHETFTIVYATLLASIIIDTFWVGRWFFLKLSFKVIVAVSICFLLARRKWDIASPTSLSELLWWMGEQFTQIQTFLWISFILLGIHVLFTLWTTTRSRLVGFVGASLLILTVADSFTPIWLWDNVAVVVFVGLVWLVLSHFSKLQQIHPESWKNLLKYPVGLLTSIVIVLSIFMLVGLNMPARAPLLQDPYTIWKNSRGEEVQLFLGEKAIAPNRPLSEQRDASSGYSRNDDTLGGGFNYDYTPIMTITTSQKSYWRGETKGFYTGSGWTEIERSTNDATAQVVPMNEPLSDSDNRPLAETADIEYSVAMTTEVQYPILFAAAPVSSVNAINGEVAIDSTNLRWFPFHWELHRRDQDQAYPTDYALTSSVTVLDEAGLRQVRSGFGEPSLAAYYTQLPDSLPERVRQLALEVTAEADSDYDKAKRLETFLRLEYDYDNKPDLKKLSGESKDFVDQFLFELQEGYCDYFSTSMVVMARTIGLAARWVKGFAPGQASVDIDLPLFDFPEDEQINPDSSGTYTVRNSDAHSWVEIYFEGYGWISFEPTAGFTFPYSALEDTEVPLQEMMEEEPIEASPLTEESTTVTTSKGLWLAAGILLLAAAVVTLVLRNRSMLSILSKVRGHSRTTNGLVVSEIEKLLRICKKNGLHLGEHETLREAAEIWSSRQSWLADDLFKIVDGFERARYSSISIPSDEANHILTSVRQLREKLK